MKAIISSRDAIINFFFQVKFEVTGEVGMIQWIRHMAYIILCYVTWRIKSLIWSRYQHFACTSANILKQIGRVEMSHPKLTGQYGGQEES